MRLLLRLVMAAAPAVFLLMGWQNLEQAPMGFGETACIGVSHSFAFSDDPAPIAVETITGRQEADNGFAWNYGYDIKFKDNQLIVSVAVNLISAHGVTRPEIDRVKPFWEKGIEQVWSKKFALETMSGKRYPIVVDVSFRGPAFHHDVIVRPGAGRTDELNWNILDSPELVAHEFGHMIGMYDEYENGALAPQDAVIDPSSIMTSNPGKGAATHARHYKRFRAWFMDKTRLRDVSLVQMRIHRGHGAISG